MNTLLNIPNGTIVKEDDQDTIFSLVSGKLSCIFWGTFCKMPGKMVDNIGFLKVH